MLSRMESLYCATEIPVAQVHLIRANLKNLVSGTQILKACARKAKNCVLIQARGVQDLILHGFDI